MEKLLPDGMISVKNTLVSGPIPTGQSRRRICKGTAHTFNQWLTRRAQRTQPGNESLFDGIGTLLRFGWLSVLNCEHRLHQAPRFGLGLTFVPFAETQHVTCAVRSECYAAREPVIVPPTSISSAREEIDIVSKSIEAVVSWIS